MKFYCLKLNLVSFEEIAVEFLGRVMTTFFTALLREMRALVEGSLLTLFATLESLLALLSE